MRIVIKRKYYKHLIQCIYLGELVINEYRNDDDCKLEHASFVKDIFQQIIAVPNIESILNLSKIQCERTEDILLSDLTDRIFDSVAEYYIEYRKSVFYDILAEKIAEKNYPIIEDNQSDCFDNILAKNLYFKLLQSGENENFVHLSAAKIDKQIERLKMELNS